MRHVRWMSDEVSNSCSVTDWWDKYKSNKNISCTAHTGEVKFMIYAPSELYFLLLNEPQREVHS